MTITPSQDKAKEAITNTKSFLKFIHISVNKDGNMVVVYKRNSEWYPFCVECYSRRGNIKWVLWFKEYDKDESVLRGGLYSFKYNTFTIEKSPA